MIVRLKQQCQHAALTLEASNPESILKRGYALAQNDAENIIKSVEDVNTGDRIAVRLHDGQLFCVVEDKT